MDNETVLREIDRQRDALAEIERSRDETRRRLYELVARAHGDGVPVGVVRERAGWRTTKAVYDAVKAVSAWEDES